MFALSFPHKEAIDVDLLMRVIETFFPGCLPTAASHSGHVRCIAFLTEDLPAWCELEDINVGGRLGFRG